MGGIEGMIDESISSYDNIVWIALQGHEKLVELNDDPPSSRRVGTTEGSCLRSYTWLRLSRARKRNNYLKICLKQKGAKGHENWYFRSLFK